MKDDLRKQMIEADRMYFNNSETSESKLYSIINSMGFQICMLLLTTVVMCVCIFHHPLRDPWVQGLLAVNFFWFMYYAINIYHSL
jgi:hypothetical protein